jgi:hypothetical protein
VLRFQEKRGKSREAPVRHDLEGFTLAYVEAAGIAVEAKDTPLIQASNGRTRTLSGKAMTSKRICEVVKRRVNDAGLPEHLSAHSFRVTAITDLLRQGVPMEDSTSPGTAAHERRGFTTGGGRKSRRISWSGFRFDWVKSLKRSFVNTRRTRL